LARRSVAKQLGLPVLGKFVAAAVIGVPPRIMGVGPLYAIPKVLKKVGLSKEDVDFYEINEAFASQALYCVESLGIPADKVNVHGGAIAIGHPLGCSTYPRLDHSKVLCVLIPAGMQPVPVRSLRV
jgi:acetyl-CoA acyltransferase 1